MIIKKYTGSSMKEVITKVERELGKDAIIISQRTVRQKGIMGFFLPKNVEVTATKDSAVNTPPPVSPSRQFPSFAKGNSQAGTVQDNELKKEVEDMKNMLNMYLKNNISETKDEESIKYDYCGKILKSLEKLDIDEEEAVKILDTIKAKGIKAESDEEVKNIVKDSLEEIITYDTSELEGIVALVGPTGVGKTTTIAKLAGNLALVKKKKVGLITVDTYRIGAVEQLKTYADIMNIHFRVVFSLKEMEDAIESMKDCEVILIDTTGRSSKNKMQVMELNAFIEKAGAMNSYLVVSATTKNKDMKIIAEGFSAINYKGIIVTKLDETASYGSIVDICHKTKLPIKYVTFGQNVPDDIKTLSSSELVEVILGEKEIC